MASSTSTSEAALRLEIARLKGAINQAKTGPPSKPTYGLPGFKNTYVNPNYKPPPRKPPTSTTSSALAQPRPQASVTPLAAKKDVVIRGVEFVSSGRSLVRKDLAPAVTSARPSAQARPYPQPNYGSSDRGEYKSKVPNRGRPRRPGNMTLDNSRRPYQSSKTTRRIKYSDKPCSQFTRTGSCNRGLTCPYQHDPAKIAICWKFLQGICSKTADTCELSHDPIPERTPLCVHFNDRGRCTRENCPFPHVRLGPRKGICRDFAMLGYCALGLDCEQAHVRECPDFAEKGACSIKGCKLPHVIRANRARQAAPTAAASAAVSALTAADPTDPVIDHILSAVSSAPVKTAEDAQLGDEYISLTFHESEDESDGESDAAQDENDVDMEGAVQEED